MTPALRPYAQSPTNVRLLLPNVYRTQPDQMS